MRKIAVISANPVEFYPPLRNLLRDPRWKGHRVTLYSMLSRKRSGLQFQADGIRCVRTVQRRSRFSCLNLLDRLWFSFRVLGGLIISRPDRILYIESNSALPVYWYRRYFNRKVGIFSHYYEYAEPEQYAREPWNGYCHGKELYLYGLLNWCSHCNSRRLEFFCRDWGVPPELSHVVPNYPPREWQAHFRERRSFSAPLKAVYIGSLSNDTMYVREFAAFVMAQGGRIHWDIFAFNHDGETRRELEELGCPWIRFFPEGVEYDRIPALLDGYDVGILLYRGHSMNYRYNETNKFYEYLICGLDVWFPSSMLLLHGYQKRGTFPCVTMADFGELKSFDWECAASHEGVPCRKPLFAAEDANSQLIAALTAGRGR